MLEQVGRYEIKEEIGQGGFAIVYRGRDTLLNRQVALKELRPVLLQDTGWAKQFRREARTIAQLDHFHIVPVYDIYQVETRLFIVMRLVQGASLDELISAQGRLSWKKIVRFITAIAEGLDYAHNHGVLHRDIKPANILIDQTRGPMLSDFGLAWLSNEQSLSITAASIVGTPNYIAPEIWEGQPATAQSDIYALGCILFEMLTGQKLFQGQTPLAVMKAHFMPPTLPNSWAADVPPGMGPVFAQLLAENPTDRFKTAHELVNVLDNLTKNTSLPKSGTDQKQPPPARTLRQQSLSGRGTGPLLTTKLFAPPIRSNLVTRPRLTQRLTDGVLFGRKLILVSAPAGFGKTTVISCWLTGLKIKARQNKQSGIVNRVAWFSLDEGDNDPVRFFTYLISSLQGIGASLEQNILAMPQLPPPETLATTLINDVAAIPEKFVLVLDDYHLIHTGYIHQIIDFILEHQPPQMHLVITTREDPPLSLPRLRARGHIVEVRQNDLRFTAQETAAFLKEVMNLQLTIQAIEALESRTEGWIAGLQLAALSLQGRSKMHVADFIEAFSGSHRYIIEYLVEEVLDQQPQNIRRFLRQTAILDRFCAPLCNAVTDQPDSRLTLNYLEQVNLFLIPLDGQRKWYRYHHLFAEFLQTELEPNQQKTLHKRASRWFEANGLFREAISHTLAAGDTFNAGQLILKAADSALHKGAFVTLAGWLNALPDDFVRNNLNLSIYKGWVLWIQGDVEAVGVYTASAEAALPPNVDAATRGKLLSLQACQAISQKSNGLELAKQALPYLDETDTFFAGMALLVLGEAQNFMGDTNGAVETLQKALQLGRKHNDHLMTIGGLTNLAQQLNYQGKRRQAEALCRQAVEESYDDKGHMLPLTGFAYITLAEIELYTGNLEETYKHLQKGFELAQKIGMIGSIISGKLVLAPLQYAMGLPEAALATAHEVLQIVTEGGFDSYLSISVALEADFQLKLGNLAHAKEWANTVTLPANNCLSLFHELELLIYTRYLLATDQPDTAQTLLARLENSAAESNRNLILLNVFLMRAITCAALKQPDAVQKVLTQAIELAEPEGYRLPFIEEGPALLKLLPTVSHVAPNFVAYILDAGHKRFAIYDMLDEKETRLNVEEQKPIIAQKAALTTTLVEPLTLREIEVLTKIATGQSNKEAARGLYVTVGTVKKHLSNIFGKLDVNSRTQAIAKARDMGLIS